MASGDQSNTERHKDLVENTSSEHRTRNPFTHSSNITVSIPESMEIRLVDASVLSDYEVWSLITSVFASAFTGFIVAWLQAPPESKTLFSAVAGIFGVLAIVAGLMALGKRHTLSRKTRKLRFCIGDEIPADGTSNETPLQ